jgi:penicillin-binding protein 1C
VHGGHDVERQRVQLDADVQRQVQQILDHRVADLATKDVSDGAVLVVDNRSGEVLAWVNAGEFGSTEGSQIDAVTTPRQPGSTLKPLLYALALGGDWSAATILNDAPIAQAVGSGLHTYRNYSRIHYGDITLREALGNSLNIPAIRTAHHVGTQDLLQFLRQSGFASLTKPADFYGEGLALGNGEVTLFELVQAYAALANRGVWRSLQVVRGGTESQDKILNHALVTPEVGSILGDILSDPQARRREFGSDSLLRLPIQVRQTDQTARRLRAFHRIGGCPRQDGCVFYTFSCDARIGGCPLQ